MNAPSPRCPQRLLQKLSEFETAGVVELARSRGPAGRFAGLRQLLTPVRGGFEAIGARRDLFSTGLAVLELLGRRAARQPGLVVAEDAHWLDPDSLDVLAFVARRVRSLPVALLFASRPRAGGCWSVAGGQHCRSCSARR